VASSSSNPFLYPCFTDLKIVFTSQTGFIFEYFSPFLNAIRYSICIQKISDIFRIILVQTKFIFFSKQIVTQSLPLHVPLSSALRVFGSFIIR